MPLVIKKKKERMHLSRRNRENFECREQTFTPLAALSNEKKKKKEKKKKRMERKRKKNERAERERGEGANDNNIRETN